MFKIGDKVYLREDSEWNDGESSNPLNIVGVVIELTPYDTFAYIVKWDNGENNSYNAEDLLLVSELEVNMFDPLVTIRQSEYDALIDEIELKDELLGDVLKELKSFKDKQSEVSQQWKPVSEYTIFDWEKARTEGAVFLQRNGDLTSILSVDSSSETSYPVKSEDGWLGVSGEWCLGRENDLDIIERIK